MEKYDLVFVGHVCYDETIHFEGSKSCTPGGAALYGAVAASKLGKKVAVILKLAPEDHGDLNLFTDNGIDVYTIDSTETTRVQVFHKSHNMDERQIITLKFAGLFEPKEMIKLETENVHLAGCNDHEFDVTFIKAVKDMGYKVSGDMQSFVRYNDPETGEISFKDDPNKKEVIGLFDKVKLDIVEAKMLTGTDDVEKAAEIVESWGCPEIMITKAEGVFVRANKQNYFEKFTNKKVLGRTGRGDTTFGSYLAWRVHNEPKDAIKYAASLVSLKMEQPGAFSGTLKDVEDKIKNEY